MDSPPHEPRRPVARAWLADVAAEALVLGRLAGPVAATYLLNFSSSLCSTFLVGHTGSLHLAASALGTMYANAAGYSILYGAATAVDTLASQAVGAGSISRVGIVVQRGIAVLGVMALPIALLWWFAGSILGHLGQDADTAAAAAVYVRLLLPGMPACLVYEVLRKGLMASGAMQWPLVCSGMALVINIGLGSALVYHTRLGFLGAPIATAISQWVMLAMMIAYFRHHRRINASATAMRVAAAAAVRLVARCCGAPGRWHYAPAPCDDGGVAPTAPAAAAPATEKIATTVLQVGAGGGAPPALRRRSPVLAPASTPRRHPAPPLGDSGVTAAATASITVTAASSRHAARSDSTAATDAAHSEDDAAAAAYEDESELLSLTAEAVPAVVAVGDAGKPSLDEAEGRRVLAVSPTSGIVAPIATALSADSPVDDLLDAIWGGLDVREALAGWPEFLSLALPGALMLHIEWAAFEVAAIIAGLDGTLSLAAHTVLASTAGVSFSFVLGISIPASIRVGQRLGERRPDAAKVVCVAAIVCAAVFAAANAAVVIATRAQWAHLFTDDDDVALRIASALPLLALYTVFDASQGVLSSVMRGLGRTGVAAVTNVVAYLVVALPLAYTLAIAGGRGLAGIWLGFIVGVATSTVLLVLVLSCLSWRAASDAAWKRATAAA